MAEHEDTFQIATGGLSEPGEDWMSASQVRGAAVGDPILVWLNYHGAAHGFEKDTSPYEFLDFIFEKGNQFEAKWVAEMAPEAVKVCRSWEDVRNPEKVRETWELMRAKSPVLFQVPLWWAPERIYGIADLVVHSSWLLDRFPDCIDRNASAKIAANLGWAEGDGHYLVLDIKFTTKLDSSDKAKDLAIYGNQVRVYSYMLGSLQGLMPDKAYLLQRRPVDEPLPVPVVSSLGTPLDPDISEIRDWYIDVRLNGASWEPWTMPEMQPNMSNDDDAPWHSAKKKISEEYVPGGELTSIYYIGPSLKEHLVGRGHVSRESMMSAQMSTVELQSIPRIGAKLAGRINVILEANRQGKLVPSRPSAIPSQKAYELFVDFENFSNVNVDFESEWPALEGCAMIFMVGVGWADADATWQFERFVAREESLEAEEEMLDAFIEFLQQHNVGEAGDSGGVNLYHWTSVEVSLLRNAADRHNRAADDLWRHLPWFDLQKEVFLKEPVGVPGAWNYKLKTIARALDAYEPNFDLTWPSDLDQGLQAMVMGWQAYRQSDPLSSDDMQAVIAYNEIDCKAIWRILSWLRELS